MIDWQKFPLRDVREILLRDFNSGKKIFDGDINSVVPRAQKSDDELKCVAEIISKIYGMSTNIFSLLTKNFSATGSNISKYLFVNGFRALHLD